MSFTLLLALFAVYGVSLIMSKIFDDGEGIGLFIGSLHWFGANMGIIGVVAVLIDIISRHVRIIIE